MSRRRRPSYLANPRHPYYAERVGQLLGIMVVVAALFAGARWIVEQVVTWMH